MKRIVPLFQPGENIFPKAFFCRYLRDYNGSYRDVTSKYIKDFDIGWKMDFGIGLDMKITDRIIMAPIIKYGFSFSNNWKGFSEFHAEESYNDTTQGNLVSLVLSFFLK